MIPFIDLKTQYLSIKDEVDDAVIRVMASCQYALGASVASFEEHFAAYCQSEFCIGTSSGTSALHLAFLAAGIGPGDEVITVSHTFVATVAAIVYAGATPVFVDICPVSYTMDPAQIEAKITSRTKAIVPVHLYGQPADMDPILDIARKHKLLVIEDAAQAHGAEYKGRRCGSMGDMGCFSFYPGKNLGAYGEAGAVVTSNPEFNHTLRMLRDWGAEKKYHHVLKGYNYRMDGIQGAVLDVKLKYLEQWTEARRNHARYYQNALSNAPLILPCERHESRHVFHIYAVRTALRDKLLEFLKENGIGAGMHYPIPVHLLEAYSDLGYSTNDFPVTEKVAAEQLSLPMFAELTEEQIDFIAETINVFSAVTSEKVLDVAV